MLVRAEDWAPRDKLHRSYELMARYVMPQFQGTLTGIQTSQQWASGLKDTLQVNRRAGWNAPPNLTNSPAREVSKPAIDNPGAPAKSRLRLFCLILGQRG